MADASLTPDLLAGLLRELSGDRTTLLHMAEAARRVALPDAAEKLYDACLAAEERT